MKQETLTLAARLTAVLAGLVSSIATARYLGPEGRGVFFFWSTVAAMVVQFGNLGLHASNMYLHARQGVDGSILAANSLVTSVAAGTCLTMLALGSMAVGGRQVALDPVLLIALVMLAVCGLYILLASNLLVAMGRLTEFNLLEVLSKLLALAVLVGVASVQQDPMLLLLSVGLASFVAAGAVMWRLLRGAPMRRPSWTVFHSGLAYGARAWLAACLAAVVARLNAFLLKPAIPASDYGAWSIASQMSDVMCLVPSSIALVLLPKVMRSHRPGAMMRSATLTTALAMLVLLLGFILIGRPVIRFLYGAAFEPAFGYVLWASPGLLALAIMTILSQYLASIGLPLALVGLWAIVAASHAALATWLIPQHGAAGAMASQSFAYLLGLVLMFILLRFRKDSHA